MCGGGSPSKPKPPAPVQPPPVVESGPSVAVGSTSDAVKGRRKVGRSQLRTTAGSNTSGQSGLGS